MHVNLYKYFFFNHLTGKLFLTEMEDEDVWLVQVHKLVEIYTSGKPQCFPFKSLNHCHSWKKGQDFLPQQWDQATLKWSFVLPKYIKLFQYITLNFEIFQQQSSNSIHVSKRYNSNGTFLCVTQLALFLVIKFQQQKTLA